MLVESLGLGDSLLGSNPHSIPSYLGNDEQLANPEFSCLQSDYNGDNANSIHLIEPLEE